MEGNDMVELVDRDAVESPISSAVAVAVSSSKKGKAVLRWALEKFVAEGEVSFKLLHVCPVIASVPTPMGNRVPIAQVREDVAVAFRKEVHWQTARKLKPYESMCTQRKVMVEVVHIESDDVVIAIAEEVTKRNITKLVIGTSSRRMFTRGPNLSSKIAKCCPKFCSVYAISKGKLSSASPASEIGESFRSDGTETSRSSSVSSDLSNRTSKVVSSHLHSPSLPAQRSLALLHLNQNILHKRTSTTTHPGNSSLDSGRGSDHLSFSSGSSLIDNVSCGVSSSRSTFSDSLLWTSDQASTSCAPADSCDSQISVNFELEKLRIELRHIRGMYALAQSEALDASRKQKDLEKSRLEKEIKLREISIKEEEAEQLVKQEKEKYENAKREADYAWYSAEKEATLRVKADADASREVKEKETIEDVLAGTFQRYQTFSWDEIVSATSSFSENLKIGMGGYGIVYKCVLRHTTVAVKVLHSKAAHITKQFQQEVEVLSRIKHPNLLILLGACPDHGCLVYEFMENGSLEDRLLKRNNAQPLPWFKRFRIAWEIASALLFLHSSNPEPIVHRDLKPANILLDQNFVSKIGDVGLSKVLHTDSSVFSTNEDTSLVGTLSYIDPEYQRTGSISLKSDVYAFGIIILQLLTAKPPLALAYTVEKALEDGTFASLLDQEAGNWPIKDTKELVRLALRCTELRCRDRPDLKDQILPILEKLKETADTACGLGSATR
ncbi:hypothetical protein Leryth_006942, partial [Lithospermum erythrorhizon]